MGRQNVFEMKVSKIYPLLLQKVERKGRSKEELDANRREAALHPRVAVEELPFI